MKKFLFFIPVLALLGASCNVQQIESSAINPIQIISPTKAQVWKQGQKYSVLWLGGASEVSIFLIDKSREAIGASASKSWMVENIQNTGHYDFTVPDDLKGEYKFYIDTNADNPNGKSAYSEYFIITP